MKNGCSLGYRYPKTNKLLASPLNSPTRGSAPGPRPRSHYTTASELILKDLTLISHYTMLPTFWSPELHVSAP